MPFLVSEPPGPVDAGSLRVLVVADDPLVRAGLVKLLGGREGLSVTGQAEAGEALPEAIELARPGVLLWDLGWHGDAAEEGPDPDQLPVPVLLLVPDEAAAEPWTGRVGGLLLRHSDRETILAGLEAVARQLVVLDPAIAPLALRRAPLPMSEESLTPRELEVLGLMAEGLPNKTIAERLGITEHTVKFHVNAVLGKLGAHSRTEAVTRAARLGLLML